jgi:hypothetical protein
MARVEFDIDDGVLARLRSDPEHFTRQLRIAAAAGSSKTEISEQALQA